MEPLLKFSHFCMNIFMVVKLAVQHQRSLICVSPPKPHSTPAGAHAGEVQTLQQLNIS